MVKRDFSKIRDMLEAQESFPTEYIHKVIAQNTPAFLESLAALEKQFPKLRREMVRSSASNAHISVTLVLRAESPEDVVALLQATEVLSDLVMVL